MLDDRPVTTAAIPPPPISGGTLAVTPDGKAIAADPDRDRVSIVDITTRTLTFTVPLSPGDEPGRVAVDDAGLAHVALRRGGAVASIDIATGQVVARRAVCGAPRGVAYDASTKLIHVACAGGELVSLPAAGGAAVRTLDLGPDLRDVIVGANGLMVSRFKLATLVPADATRSAQSPIATSSILRNTQVQIVGFPAPEPSTSGPGALPSTPTKVEALDPDGAWRTFSGPDGTLYMLHQYGLAEEIDIDPAQGSGAAYGGGTPCSPR